MTEIVLDQELQCHHCGDTCDDDGVVSGNHHFCCYGCKAVNELLENSELGLHYTETSRFNKSVSERRAAKKYGFLDHDDIQRELLSFKDEQFSVIRFSLPAIHCSSCIYLLEHLSKLDTAIVKSEVNFVRKTVTVTFRHSDRSLREIAVLLAQLGYPPDISLDNIDGKKRKQVKSDLPMKIAVAGFCFGNAMLMSMPDYLDNQFQLTGDFKGLFGWISLALAIPVVVYSGQDYFVKAWKGIRVGRANIDLPIALGILTLFVRSAYEIMSLTGMGYVDSLTGLVFLLLIGKWYQGKTYQALSFERDYASYFPVSITCLIDGVSVTRSLKELKRGDVVLIHNDELIPADGKIVAGVGNIDYSFVTGESEPMERLVGADVYAGGRQKGGELTVLLTRKVNNSELTKLWNSDVFVKARPDLHTWVDRISAYFTVTIVALALGTGIYWYLMDDAVVWNAVTAVLIVACPCALALVLPFAYGHAMRMYGRHGLYLKNAEVVESMAAVNKLVFDKTGTLTRNQADVRFVGIDLEPNEITVLKSVLGNSAHPLSRIIHESLKPCEKRPITTFHEETGKGITAEIDGIVVKIGSAGYLGVKAEIKNNEAQVHIQLGSYKGYFAITAAYREGIFDMLDDLKPAYELHLLSGDNDGERTKLAPYFNEVYFNQRPGDKLSYLEKLSGDVLMIGDGLNDAGALKRASVGIAVADDIHQFSPACDAILSSEKVESLPKVLTFAKSVVNIVFVAFGLSFLYNIVGLSFAITGHLTPLVSAILMPISSVTVVGFVTFMVQRYARSFPTIQTEK